MTAPKIQKNLATTCACEITQQIICDIVDDVFGVLLMNLVMLLVNKKWLLLFAMLIMKVW